MLLRKPDRTKTLPQRSAICVWLLLFCLVYPSGEALTQDVKKQKIQVGKTGSQAVPLVNGKAEVALLPCNAGGEFPTAWAKELAFVEAPQNLCVRWIDKTVTEKANWELYKVIANAADQKIADGEIAPATLAGSSSKFQIELRPPLPKLNTNTSNQKYRVVVKSKKQLSGSLVNPSLAAILVHKPQPPPGNPYNCTSGPARKVVLDIPEMSVLQTSNTSGDGDRDELYFEIIRNGPAPQLYPKKRLPGLDDYYEAKNSKAVNSTQWTNQDESQVGRPVIWSGTLNHGQIVKLSLTAKEQDNSDLASIKAGIVQALVTVAAVAAATGTPQGAVVAAVAGGGAAATEIFVPETSGHDFIGFVELQVTNRCGYIQTAWVTFSEKNTEAGKVSNDFIDVGTLEDIESRLAVFDLTNQFWPNGVDWTPYVRVNGSDKFIWAANGTSGSKYQFILRAKVTAVGN
jgi:hypothetical protein